MAFDGRVDGTVAAIDSVGIGRLGSIEAGLWLLGGLSQWLHCRIQHRQYTGRSSLVRQAQSVEVSMMADVQQTR